ncbi:hypothetical protein [Bradyrhizobium sp. McL0616]|uniref:hypothetical protein n=1 Tax=Bradyrhizobium sp. McL0616 TaxID=3415674 RepID=UPI003CEF5AE6
MEQEDRKSRTMARLPSTGRPLYAHLICELEQSDPALFHKSSGAKIVLREISDHPRLCFTPLGDHRFDVAKLPLVPEMALGHSPSWRARRARCLNLNDKAYYRPPFAQEQQESRFIRPVTAIATRLGATPRNMTGKVR